MKKLLIVSDKILFFAFEESKCNEFLKTCTKIMPDRGIRNAYCGLLTALPVHIRVVQASNDSADTMFARYGQFEENEKTTAELNIFLSKSSFDKIII